MLIDPSPVYGSLGRYATLDTHCSTSTLNKSLTLPRNCSNLSSCRLAKKNDPAVVPGDVQPNTLVLSCEVFDIPTVGDLIESPAEAFRVDPPTNFSDDAINQRKQEEFGTSHSIKEQLLDCKHLVMAGPSKSF